MELLSKAFGIYETNCYILKTAIGDFIIDAGVDSAQWVVDNATNPLCILNTHGHFDHIWCNAELKERLQIPIFCPKGDAFMLKSDCFDLGLKPCAPDIEVEPNQILKFGDIAVEFMHFAGHTPGCSMIKISGSDSSLRGDLSPKQSKNKSVDSVDSSSVTKNDENLYIFSGDFIFYRTIGRSDFPYSSPKDMGESLQRFGALDYDAQLYPGHGQSTTIKDEQKNLPFYLRGLIC